jgi:hypothetical protein
MTVCTLRELSDGHASLDPHISGRLIERLVPTLAASR